MLDLQTICNLLVHAVVLPIRYTYFLVFICENRLTILCTTYQVKNCCLLLKKYGRFGLARKMFVKIFNPNIVFATAVGAGLL